MVSRTQFVTYMKARDSTFMTSCNDYMSTTSGLNNWYDPMQPLVTISKTEVCELH